MTSDEDLVNSARGGDRAALDALIRSSKDLVYNLAVRMLGDHADAEDTSQEILVRIVTGLANFRGESSFKTWVYRVASNHLLTARRRRAEEKTQSFEALAEYLDEGIAADLPPLDEQVLVSEAKLRCTSTMLLCLDRDHRLAYILGEILELSSEEGAVALEISTDAFRKRLSRARTRMSEFMTDRCGLVDPSRPCRCAKQGARAVKEGRLSLPLAVYATHPTNPRPCTHGTPRPPAEWFEELGPLERVVATFRSHPDYAAPSSLTSGLQRTLDARAP